MDCTLALSRCQLLPHTHLSSFQGTSSMVANSVVNAWLWACHFSAQKASVASYGPKCKVQPPLPDICPARDSNLSSQLTFSPFTFLSCALPPAKLNYYFCYEHFPFSPPFPTIFVYSPSSGSTLLSPNSSLSNSTYSSTLLQCHFHKAINECFALLWPLKTYCSSLWGFVALYLDLWHLTSPFVLKLLVLTTGIPC